MHNFVISLAAEYGMVILLVANREFLIDPEAEARVMLNPECVRTAQNTERHTEFSAKPLIFSGFMDGLKLRVNTESGNSELIRTVTKHQVKHGVLENSVFQPLV